MRRSSEPVSVNFLRSGAAVSSDACTAILRFCSMSAQEELRKRQLRSIWRLYDAYRDAAGGPLSLSEILSRLSKEISELRDTLLLWVDSIESMIQEVELLYGPAPRLGSYKAAQVKAAVLYIVQHADQGLRLSTFAITETGLEVVIDWFIDGIVLLLNRRGLWQLSSESELQLAYWFRLRTRAATLILDLLGIVQEWIVGRTAMLPQVRRIAEKAVHEEGGLSSKIKDSFDFVLWFVAHRQQLLGLLDLVATATMEAESFVQMSGSEKQRYAREMVLLAAQELWDEWPDSPVWAALAQGLIDFTIDGVVRIFNKRGLFGPQSRTGESLRLVPA